MANDISKVEDQVNEKNNLRTAAITSNSSSVASAREQKRVAKFKLKQDLKELVYDIHQANKNLFPSIRN